MIKIFLTMFLLLAVGTGYSQSAADLILEGNKSYREGDYKKAESSYRKSVEKNSQYDFQGRYNLANSLFMLKDYEGARNIYASLLQKNPDKAAQNKLYHNIGNTYLMEKKYQESIAAYKNALKNNPNDEDARYNLSYALKKLQQQQQNKNNKNNKDQNKDPNKDKDQNKDNNKDQKKDDQKKDQDKDQQNKPDQQKNQKNELNQQQAEQMLKALQNKEKQTQREIHANPAQSGDEKKGTGAGYKDW